MKRVPPESKALSANPKDLIGSTKVSISKFPTVALMHGAMALMDGAEKYGPYNWRDKDVIASIYVDTAYRHLMDWFEGQEKASDSKVHHLGHAIACLAILLDAQATGNLIDDRPLKYDEDGNRVDVEWFERLLGKMSGVIKEKQEAKRKCQN
jgi:Domain of unknown function (DUF5664)